MVEMTSGSTPCRSIGSTMRRLNSRPRTRSATTSPTTHAGQKRQPKNFIAARMKKAGSITNSPCAKLMVCEVCHSSVKPTATRA